MGITWSFRNDAQKLYLFDMVYTSFLGLPLGKPYHLWQADIYICNDLCCF